VTYLENLDAELSAGKLWNERNSTSTNTATVFMKPHLLGQLAHSKEGRELLKKRGIVQKLISQITDPLTPAIQQRAALLALGHIAAIGKLEEKGCFTYNLGVGRGYSVLEMIHAMEKAAGKKIPYKITPRRPGDVAELTSDPSKALRELGWKATRNIDDMCADIWHWQTQNPRGYHVDEPSK